MKNLFNFVYFLILKAQIVVKVRQPVKPNVFWFILLSTDIYLQRNIVDLLYKSNNIECLLNSHKGLSKLVPLYYRVALRAGDGGGES